jgi:hypothetical protein
MIWARMLAYVTRMVILECELGQVNEGKSRLSPD